MCVECNLGSGCATCSDNKCTTCVKGYFLDDETGHCLKCSDFMPHCDECKTKDTCLKCANNIATLQNGMCECNTAGNWIKDEAGSSC